ncbi:MAG: hypothetical protein ACRDEA_05335 [Microcystaceae cyanobacterium]
MLSASDLNELKALSQKYTRTEMVWVYRNLLSAPQRQQIVAVAAAQQLTLLEE